MSSSLDKARLWLGVIASGTVVVTAVISAFAWISGAAGSAFDRAVQQVVEESFDGETFTQAVQKVAQTSSFEPIPENEFWAVQQGEETRMIPVGEGVCYLVEVPMWSGSSAVIFADGGHWYLRWSGATTMLGDQVAAARCWRFPGEE